MIPSLLISLRAVCKRKIRNSRVPISIGSTVMMVYTSREHQQPVLEIHKLLDVMITSHVLPSFLTCLINTRMPSRVDGRLCPFRLFIPCSKPYNKRIMSVCTTFAVNFYRLVICVGKADQAPLLTYIIINPIFHILPPAVGRYP